MAVSPDGARRVVTGFGVLRVGLGAAFLIAPRRMSRGEDVLMTRSFAVRELVLGLAALRRASQDTGEWARLGALVDRGDAGAAAIALRSGVPMAAPSLLAALAGLAAETWAATVGADV